MVTGSTITYAYPSLTLAGSSLRPTNFHFATEKGELPCKVGIEYTFISETKPLSTSDALHRYNEMDNLISIAKNENGYNQYKEFRRIHFDNGCVEIPSPPHEQYADVINYYNRVTGFSKKHGLTGAKDKYPGGGMHVHLDFPKKLKLSQALKFLKDIYIDIANRPYLNWIFNEPMDNVNANSFFTDKASYTFIQTIEKSYAFDYNALVDANFWHKGKPIRYDEYTNTIEFRIFDMARSEAELTAILNFVCNYYEKFLMRYDNTQPNYSYSENCEYLSNLKHTRTNFNNIKRLDYYLSDFWELCKELHLDYDHYVTFIQRNYKTRAKWGKEYLK